MQLKPVKHPHYIHAFGLLGAAIGAGIDWYFNIFPTMVGILCLSGMLVTYVISQYFVGD
ncbi:hypothetical protein OE749_16765 [Aestuariibacter sp. AA17]|uniref:Uncharacterized protein n=1 Tax=Fluctibacter corallii TaxID=2984329 RepID=A0ABT3ACF0_9ALTE|nr:hypothetical protein [Aestuariibacter sp. AA17]MCV2886349.1 hypothetical protein [Aestuariibacter sp. AA17]